MTTANSFAKSCSPSKACIASLLGEHVHPSFLSMFSEITHLSISQMAVSVHGNTPEDSYLFTEILLKGHECRLLDISVPIMGSTAQVVVNKDTLAYTSANDASELHDLLLACRALGACISYGDAIPFLA